MNVKASPTYPCLICRAFALLELPRYKALARVTSDCKPWPAGGRLMVCEACGAMQKLPDPDWLGDIDRIYDGYAIYHQAGGAEQPIFDPAGGGAPRSIKLIRHLLDTLPLSERGRLLDFGCGNGMALRNFAAALPRWELFASELSERVLPALERIAGFSALYTCSPDEIPGRFALITLIHSLEHVLDPIATLAALRERVEDEGHVFVQVPDCGATPYDLAVADHLMHFTSGSLRNAGDRAGYRSIYLSNSVLTKELSWIGRPDATAVAGTPPEPRLGLALAQRHLAWLEDQIAAAKKVAANSNRFGIFGTSISATWLYGVLRERVDFFVDEDRGRIGRTHMDLPVLGPDGIPADSDVFVPLIPEVAASVGLRLAGRGGRVHGPPALDAAAIANVA